MLRALNHADSSIPSFRLRRLHARIDASHALLFLEPRRLHIVADCCTFVSPFGAYGTLQDVINVRGGVSELVSAWCAIELLRCLEVLHSASILHNDVKPDNVLLRLGGAEWSEWDASGWWPDRGLLLIDYGESIDLAEYHPGAVFVGDVHTANFRCVPMLSNAPWRWQPDTFGALGCIHALLHGSWMRVEVGANGRWRCATPWKRYFAEFWPPLFDVLLNQSGAECVPLAPLRATIERWLARPDRALLLRKEMLELTLKLASG